jgi:hypothetical protein
MSYPMEHQEMGLWCWAAVSLSIAKYFDPATAFSQCAVASAVKNRNCCANKPSCNQADELEAALTAVKRFRRMFTGRLTFAAVRQSIRDGFPIPVRIGWRPAGGHYVVITGFKTAISGEQFVDIADPLYESRLWRYNDFLDAYYGSGVWTHTYEVKE